MVDRVLMDIIEGQRIEMNAVCDLLGRQIGDECTRLVDRGAWVDGLDDMLQAIIAESQRVDTYEARCQLMRTLGQLQERLRAINAGEVEPYV